MAFIPSTKDQWVFCQILYKSTILRAAAIDALVGNKPGKGQKCQTVQTPVRQEGSSVVVDAGNTGYKRRQGVRVVQSNEKQV